MSEKIDPDFVFSSESPRNRYNRVLREKADRVNAALDGDRPEELRLAVMDLNDAAIELDQGDEDRPLDLQIKNAAERINKAFQCGDRNEIRAILQDLRLPEMEEDIRGRL